MKTANPAVNNAIRTAYDVNAVPRLTVEWNLNRYADVSVDNEPSEDTDGYDIENFPIESIISGNRPTAGINKARVGEAAVADPYDEYDGKSRSARYYVSSPDDTYKYWTSPFPSDDNGDMPRNATDSSKSTIRPAVEYSNGVKSNRIVVGFEDTWTQPNDFTIKVKTSEAGSWTTVSTNPSINSKGQVIINHNGTSWSVANSPTNDYPSMPTLYGVMVEVNSLGPGLAQVWVKKGGSWKNPIGDSEWASGKNSHFSLIEISARRVQDLTDRLISVSDTFDMAEKSLVYPIGTITSNTATATFFNGDGLFNSESGSEFADLMEPNAIFNLEYIYTVGGNSYTVQQFKMFGGPWAGQRAEEVSVELTDYSKYFQEIKPRAACYQDRSASEIVWQICDSVGFVDYEIQRNDVTTDHKIPVWWTDGELTVWELFDELAKASQTAIYFDHNGKLQVRTREAAFDSARSVDWTLRGDDAGTELADIVSLEQTDELQSNLIKVSYTQTDIDPVVNGLSKNQVLWEPDGTVALRACALYKDLNIDDDFVCIPPKEAKIWPFEGMMNIQGEFIKYKGKRFVYYEGGDRKTVVVKDNDELQKYNNKTPFAQRHKNHLTGQLKVDDYGRGVWNSEEKSHKVDINGYSVRNIINGNRHVGVNGLRHDKAHSRAVLNTIGKSKKPDDILLATRGNDTDPAFSYHGVRMRFEKRGGKHQRAGLVIHNNSNNEDGYYIELTPFKKIKTGKQRAQRHELMLYTRNNGKFKSLGKGPNLAIVEDRDFDLDVQFKAVDGDHQITIWFNGRLVEQKTITGADKNPVGGKFGMFARGDTTASYEFLYAISNLGEDPLDDFSFLDKKAGGMVGGLERDWIYGWHKVRRRVKRKWTKMWEEYKIAFFDEFGPVVHEIREYKVKFDPFPAITSRLYMGNDWSAICPEYSADSFGARFYIANTDRQTAIVHGEDSLEAAGSSSTINPILTVIGRSITTKDAQEVEAKNEEQIRKRGEIETEISSTWIQSKPMAQDIANWIKDHWSEGADELTVSAFGNPLIELGDVVNIEYPELDMSTTSHKYFVVGVSNSFDTGLDTALTLRRVV